MFKSWKDADIVEQGMFIFLISASITISSLGIAALLKAMFGCCGK